MIPQTTRNRIENKCIMCGKKRNEEFYDKSDYRPLCNKQCYSDWFDDCRKRDLEYANNWLLHKEKHLIACERWQQNNKDKVRGYNRKWRENRKLSNSKLLKE